MLIYEDMKDGRAVPKFEAPGLDAARNMLAAVAQSWKATKKGRKATIDGLHLILRWSDGKVARMLTIDAVPMPTTEPDAQPRRKKGEKA